MRRCFLIMCLSVVTSSIAYAAVPTTQQCPSGQTAAMHVVYAGRITGIQYAITPPEIFPDLGIAAEEKLWAQGGYSKSIISGVAARATKDGNIVYGNLHWRQTPYRKVTIKTPTDSYEYDELGPRPGKHSHTEPLSDANQKAVGDFFMRGLSGLAAQTPAIGKATYAGVECTEHAVSNMLADSINGRSCVASLNGTQVVLAQDWLDRKTGRPQTMHATQVEMNKCVSATEFMPPANVKFRTTSSPQKNQYDDDNEKDSGEEP